LVFFQAAAPLSLRGFLKRILMSLLCSILKVRRRPFESSLSQGGYISIPKRFPFVNTFFPKMKITSIRL
jgi:hypothetical protein